MTRSNVEALGDLVAEGQSASWGRAFALNRYDSLARPLYGHVPSKENRGCPA